MTALISKELRQTWRSFRLPALMLVLLFLAIMDPLVTMYMDEILARFVEGVTIVLPPPSSALAIGQFLGDVAELGILVVIGISMGSVASEKANGVASFVVTRPATRIAYVAAKYIVLLGGLTLALAATTLVASLYSLTVIGPVDVGRVIPAAVSAWIFSAFILNATFAASMIARSSLAAGGIGFAVYFVTAAAGGLLDSTAAGPWLPSALISNINIFLSGSGTLDVATRLLKPGAVVLLLSTLFLGLGLRLFKHQDLP
jgi:ABC-2 type transport system permease protein